MEETNYSNKTTFISDSLAELQRKEALRYKRDETTKSLIRKNKIGRNEKCPFCDSGKKYKKCCIDKE